MKQHITLEQVMQLKDEEVCKLNTLMKHEWNITQEQLKKYTWPQICLDTSKFCTIGKMIEILSRDNNRPIEIANKFTDKIGNLIFESTYLDKEDEEKEKYNIDLCDALWEAVKEIL